MYQFAWTHTTITTNAQANACLKLIKELQPTVGAFDTETTGLNIGTDKAFLFQFGFIDIASKKGYTYVVDIERQPQLAKQVITAWHKYAIRLTDYIGHNVKFDLHMLRNTNLPYLYNNLTDTQFYIRYAHDALTPANGGPPLGLKAYSAKYIDHTAKSHEKELNHIKSQIAKEINLKLKQRLASCGSPPSKYKTKSYTLSVIEDMFKDAIFEISDLPEPIRTKYLDWLHLDVPIYLQNLVEGVVTSDIIPYDKLPRDKVIKYAHQDIVLTLEIYYFLKETVKARNNEKAIQMENDLIIPLYHMESTGFKADKEYLEQARIKLKNYIIKKRKELYTLAGQEIKIGQHETIKKVLSDKFNIKVVSTANDELAQTISRLEREKCNPEAIKFIKIIQDLRTLEKWYSAYIMRFIKGLQKSDRLYTQINQVGTVSCRVTSDFQQFPKAAIKDDEGNEIFHPRRVVLADNTDGYKGIVYLDYSQIELRFQAFYTILVGHPDLNLCRAYMPYKCVNKQGELFDYNNPEHIKNWNAEWYYEEDRTKHWIPTDVHGATTKAAFNIDETHPDYHDLRYIGKRVNFAKNYGAQYKKICSMFPNRTEEECRRIDAAYYKAFPGVKEYHNYCYKAADSFGHVANMFGINYYGLSGHKLINTLIQGSAAVYLKYKIIEIDKYMTEHKMHSKLQMQIHDELSWIIAEGEEEEFFKLKEIMETWNETKVPLVADMEATTTTWADKVEINTLEELKCLIN